MGGMGGNLELYLGVKVFRDSVIALERGLEEIERFYRDAWDIEFKDTKKILKKSVIDGLLAGGITTVFTGHIDLGAIIGAIAGLFRFFREYINDSRKFKYAKVDKIERKILKGIDVLLDVHKEVSENFVGYYMEKLDRDVAILYVRFYRGTRRLYNFLSKIKDYFDAIGKESEKLNEILGYLKGYLDRNLLRYHRTRMFLRRKDMKEYPINVPPTVATVGATVV